MHSEICIYAQVNILGELEYLFGMAYPHHQVFMPHKSHFVSLSNQSEEVDRPGQSGGS